MTIYRTLRDAVSALHDADTAELIDAVDTARVMMDLSKNKEPLFEGLVSLIQAEYNTRASMEEDAGVPLDAEMINLKLSLFNFWSS